MRPMDQAQTAAVRSFFLTSVRDIHRAMTLSTTILILLISIFLVNSTRCFAEMYAARVIEYVQGTGGVSEYYGNPNSILGQPEYNTETGLSLGVGGYVILAFDCTIQPGTGYDFKIVETGTPEYYMIYGSDDFGKTWTYINKSGGTVSFDLPATTKPFNWMKIVDYYSRTGYPYSGCDLDGVVVYNAGPPLLEAKIEVDPAIFNLNSLGEAVDAYIQLPLPYNPVEIDIPSVTIKIDSQVDTLNAAILDQDADGIDELAVPFNEQLTINVDGKTTNGAIFKGQKILENPHYTLPTCDKEIEENKTLTEEVQALKTEIEGLKTENSSLQNDKENLSLQVQNLTSERDGLNLQVQSLTGENGDLKAQIQTLTNQIQSLTIDAESCRGERVGLKAQIEAALNEIEALKGQNKDLEEENKKLKEQYGNNGNGNDNGNGTGNGKGNNSGK